MYANPAIIRQTSNREDLILTVALYDDDTNQPIDLSYATWAMLGAPFTGSAWTVTTSGVAVPSTTSLTIPYYPIGSELTSVALTVAPNLPIVPGNPVTIADANPANSMTGYVTSYATGTGALVCQIGVTFQLEIRRTEQLDDWDWGYTTQWNFGTLMTDAPLIIASLGNGLSIIDLGRLQIRIAEAIMRKLTHRSYNLNLTCTDSFDTRQIFIGHLPMLYGGVTR